jgi:hypothetical protein
MSYKTVQWTVLRGERRELGRAAGDPDMRLSNWNWLWTQSGVNLAPLILADNSGNSLLNRENTGNFPESGPKAPILSGIPPVIPMLRSPTCFLQNRELACP